MNIGIMLRYYRKLKAITQEQVAEGANINEKYYGRIERNESTPTIDKFSLFGISEANVCMILNLSVINNMFEELYYMGTLKGYTIYGEAISGKRIESYKCDYYFPKENLLVENKTIINKTGQVIYPTETFKHIKNQLTSIIKILKKGYKVKYNIFILSPWVNLLLWNEKIESLIEEAQRLGMKIMFYYLYYENDVLKVQAAKLRLRENKEYDIVFT